MVRELLVDGDVLLYWYAIRNEYAFDFGDTICESTDEHSAKREVDEYLTQLMDELVASRMIVCLSDDKENWRNDILPTYKANRDHGMRPALHGVIRQHLEDEYEVMTIPRLEADDVMGILQTADTKYARSVERIIVSIDKDMLTVPGKVYDPKSEELVDVSVEEADRNHLHQTLTGDPVDNYKGCYGIGKKKAEKLLSADHTDPTTPVWRVWKTFESKGYSWEDFLVQAQVARILRREDFNKQTGEPILWQPHE